MIKTRLKLLLYCLSLLLVLVLPVFADPMIPTTTKVFITQNGIPVDSTVDFSLDCFGRTVFYGYDYLPRHGIEKALNITGDDDIVYAYSATCRPTENCIVHKPDKPWMINISHCDLSGTYKGQPFLLKNFSTEPMSLSERKIQWAGEQSYYVITDKAERECSNQKAIEDQACEKILNKNLETASNSSAYPEFWQCGNESVARYFECVKNNGIWINETNAGDALTYYELQFDIPSDNKKMGTATSPGMRPEIFNKSTIFSINPLSDRSLQDYTVKSISPAVPRSPVESLFCRILSIFNASC